MKELDDGPLLRVEWLQSGHDWVVRLRGELDLSTAGAAEKAIAEVRAAGAESVVFELSELDFMDSSGLTVLLSAVQQIDSVRLRSPSINIRRLIEISGLTKVLVIAE